MVIILHDLFYPTVIKVQNLLNSTGVGEKNPKIRSKLKANMLRINGVWKWKTGQFVVIERKLKGKNKLIDKQTETKVQKLYKYIINK